MTTLKIIRSTWIIYAYTSTICQQCKGPLWKVEIRDEKNSKSREVMRGYWCLNGIKIDNTPKWKCLPMAYHYAQTYMLKVNKIRRLRCPKSHDQYSIFEKSVNSLREKPLSNRSEASGGRGCIGKLQQLLTKWLFVLCVSSKSLLETDNSNLRNTPCGCRKHGVWCRLLMEKPDSESRLAALPLTSWYCLPGQKTLSQLCVHMFIIK